MTAKRLSASITGCTNIISVTMSEAHNSATSVLTVQCLDTTLDIGDAITASLGYDGSNTKVFDGYVKRIEHTTPDGVYAVTANDALIRAVDYFIVGANQEEPYKFNHIDAEDLIGQVLSMAGLYDFDFDASQFTFGINNDVEVNLVSSYDYSRMISDLLAWEIWCDYNGTVHFANRKPYVMETGTPEELQPGFNADTSYKTIYTPTITNLVKAVNERELRNKIVVYGKETLSATAQSATSYDPVLGSSRQILPPGFYKAAVLASPLIEQQSFAEKACDYNLALYNRLMYDCPLTIEGDPSLHARMCVTVESDYFYDPQLWYIYQLEHSFNSGGFSTNILLRK